MLLGRNNQKDHFLNFIKYYVHLRPSTRKAADLFETKKSINNLCWKQNVTTLLVGINVSAASEIRNISKFTYTCGRAQSPLI